MERKGIIYLENIFINIYAPNNRAPKYIKQMLLTDLKGEIDNNAVIVRDFSTPLSTTDRTYRQKINEERQIFNDTLD